MPNQTVRLSEDEVIGDHSGFVWMLQKGFTDSDMELMSGWLSTCLQMLSSLQEAGLPHTIQVKSSFTLLHLISLPKRGGRVRRET